MDGMEYGLPTSPTAPSLVLHLPLGSVDVVGRATIGRGTTGVPDDPRVSRQHAVVSFDAHTAAASLKWMARPRGSAIR